MKNKLGKIRTQKRVKEANMITMRVTGLEDPYQNWTPKFLGKSGAKGEM